MDCVDYADSYLGLHQEVPLCADVFQEAHDVHCALLFDLPKHAIQHDVGTCSSHASTEGKANTGMVLSYSLPLFNITTFVRKSRMHTLNQCTYANDQFN